MDEVRLGSNPGAAPNILLQARLLTRLGFSLGSERSSEQPSLHKGGGFREAEDGAVANNPSFHKGGGFREAEDGGFASE